MRTQLQSFLLLALAGCGAATQGAPAVEADLAITHVSVIDVERGTVVPDRTVLIKANRILDVAPASKARVASGVRTIDGRNRYLMPGLWDMHAHVHFSGRSPEVEFPLFIAHGVTGARVMNAGRPSVRPTAQMILAMHRTWQSRIEAGTLVGPRLLAMGSWVVNGASGISDSMPAWFKARTTEEGQQLARYFKEQGFDFIKIYNNVSREGYFGLAGEARKIGIPFAGHEPVRVSAIEISNAGQKSIEHSRIFLFNCWPGADSMQKGLLRASQTVVRQRMVDEYDPKICAEVFKTFVKNGTWITPTHGTRKMDAFADNAAFRNDPRRKYVLLPQQVAWLQDADRMVAGDSTAAGRKSFMDFYTRGLELTNAAYRAGVKVMLGTDSGDSFIFPGDGVHDELGELVKAGLTPAEALRAATLAGAEFLGRTAEFGTVATGRFADLVLLDANPLENIANSRKIRTVLFNGRVFERAALDSMLASVERVVKPTAQQEVWAGATLNDTTMIARGLAGGANIDGLDVMMGPSGRRALNYAAVENNVAAVQMLIARGASLNLANNTGFTPVHHAAENGSLEALKLLMAAGADINLKTKAGALPIDIAKQRDNKAVIAALEGKP
ncbi:MAG TPA: amidohydrolase family protein [Gemmatimonadales bacterium]|nr:amidohydrolase family protein [Gemmatimonadales bacterium]